ncbi:hypothetical protein AAF712_008305 [Marasmius tenuissimus]|uniref:Uncharacterized protein n=1 Tax=Marasmius tenuissimus TaxID=585030 RepID=A0ABR2ZVF3_9AGAR|nr:hypothetical protein PM082_004903 [Marasmius tenuissimus]
MSISVDDLVCSLSSNHIGQEAMDLAALQAQLTQAFFGQPPAPLSSPSTQKSAGEPSQRCNTPTGRTPSSSFSWGTGEAQRVPRWNTDDAVREIDDVEDERMVEDILLPSSPVSAGSSPFAHQPSFRTHRSQNRTNSVSTPMSPSFGTDSSLFAATDPFYLAQIQAMQGHNASSPSSVFSQLGRPSQHSPFVNQGQKYEPFAYPGSSISLESHNMVATTSGSFER